MWVNKILQHRTTSSEFLEISELLAPFQNRFIYLQYTRSEMLLFHIAALLVFGSAHSQIIMNKWENSKIWPAASVERYNETDGNSQHVALMRTFKADAFQFEYPVASMYDASMIQILQAAEVRFGSFLERIVPVPSVRNHPVNPDKVDTVELLGIRFDIQNHTTLLYQSHNIDESYQIQIPYPNDASQKWIELHAETVYGALHGLETVKQLIHFAWMENDQAVFLIRDTPLFIKDQPSYYYRGLMIDTARHYLPLDLIQTNLNAMAANKLNVLHWHMTDSESWPYQSARFPELSQAGAYCPECTYNASQIETVVKEAALLGIRVIVEIDLAGHAQGTCEYSAMCQ